MKRLIFLFIIILIRQYSLTGQDFVDYFLFGNSLNPVLSSQRSTSQLSTLYGDDLFFGTKYKMGLDLASNKFKSGSGIYYTRQIDLNRIKLSTLSMKYYYKQPIFKKSSIAVGLQYNYKYRRHEFYKRPDYSDTTNLPRIGKTSHSDLTFSTLINFNNFWIGMSIENLFGKEKSLYDGEYFKYPNMYKIQSGLNFKLGNNRFDILFLYNFIDESSFYDFGLSWQRRNLLIGIGSSGYKRDNFNTLYLLAGYRIKDLIISYNYNFSRDNPLNISLDSHSFSLIYHFNLGAIRNSKDKKQEVPGVN